MLRIGIDIGGTFTDFVVFHPQTGQVESFKLLSSPHDPSAAVLAGLQRLNLAESAGSIEIVHGTTVATNALLERKGAKTALVTTRGFADVLQIGRQNRSELYHLIPTPASPLIPAELRFEVDERVDHTGQVLLPLNDSQVDNLLPRLEDQSIESIAICLLFSFLHPAHEQKIAERLRQAGYLVSVSSEILPEFREYERTSTTVINAYVSPILDRYLSHLKIGLEGACAVLKSPKWISMRIMQSNGGAISLDEARHSGVRCILSGPAGGIVGAQRIAEAILPPASRVQLITFDMGGTSTDVSLIDGEPLVTTEAQVSNMPIRVPILDIHTIGAGGGSIAFLDAGGALRVGPQSAGADPGPACYCSDPPPLHPERLLPTVTDANLVLGRLLPDHFLGGTMPLNPERAHWALERLGEQLNLDVFQTALGMIEIVDAHMERALRLVSVERGHDPRRFSLLSFGGAGGLHACSLAHRLGIPRIIIPPHASVLSAFGMLAAEVIRDYSQTVMLPGDTPASILIDLLTPLKNRGLQEMQQENISDSPITFHPQLDMRYQGQSYELAVPWRFAEDDFLTSFHELHQSTYGYKLETVPVEIVNLRLRLVGHVPTVPLTAYPVSSPDPQNAFLEHRPVVLASPPAQQIPLYRGESLRPGNRIAGPALIVRTDTTIFLPAGDDAVVDPFLNILITI